MLGPACGGCGKINFIESIIVILRGLITTNKNIIHYFSNIGIVDTAFAALKIILFIRRSILLRIGLFGFGKTGRSVATSILNNKDHTLEWVIRKSKMLDHRSAPEFLGIKSSEPGLIYSIEDLQEVFNKVVSNS